jgi:hypothetical protein
VNLKIAEMGILDVAHVAASSVQTDDRDKEKAPTTNVTVVVTRLGHSDTERSDCVVISGQL